MHLAYGSECLLEILLTLLCIIIQSEIQLRTKFLDLHFLPLMVRNDNNIKEEII